MLGLNIVKVSGYAKGYGYYQGKQFESTDHAWIAFQIDEQWYLMDPTWGAGYVDDDKNLFEMLPLHGLPWIHDYFSIPIIPKINDTYF